jgi:hypothetical protein
MQGALVREEGEDMFVREDVQSRPSLTRRFLAALASAALAALTASRKGEAEPVLETDDFDGNEQGSGGGDSTRITEDQFTRYCDPSLQTCADL